MTDLDTQVEEAANRMIAKREEGGSEPLSLLEKDGVKRSAEFNTKYPGQYVVGIEQFSEKDGTERFDYEVLCHNHDWDKIQSFYDTLNQETLDQLRVQHVDSKE